jgi:c-di-GMP-binding flagellar brake protein YcgR
MYNGWQSDRFGNNVFIEQRQAERKVLKTKAKLTVDGEDPIVTRTVDISASGMSLALPGPLPVGRPSQIIFDLVYEGKATPVNARTKVAYCIFSNGEFKVGFRFITLDLTAMTVLSKYLR